MDLEEILAQLEPGKEELVIVDARTLRLLLGDLAQLVILKPLEIGPAHLRIGDEEFIWDHDEPC
ncbi:MAG: hypothetical protein ABFS23_11140 [Pseudomonadota bacterium]